MARIAKNLYSLRFLQKWRSMRGISLPFLQHNMSSQAQAVTKEIKEETESLIDPLKHPDFFQVHNLFTVQDLFDARVHYGHKETALNDHMGPFIFGSRLGHLIIDLDKTADYLRRALNFTAHIAFRGGIILFISKNPQSTYIVDKTAKECGEYSQTRRWKLETFPDSTNYFKAVTRLPELCIFIHTMSNALEPHIAITHAAKLCIPSIGIVDTNCNPNLISYPVPGNDDTPSAIDLYCRLFKEAILRGKTARKRLFSSVNTNS